jgi:hypothetical protein
MQRCDGTLSGDRRDRERACQDALVLMAQDPVIDSRPQRVQAYGQLARGYLENGRIAEAVAQLDSVKALSGAGDKVYADAAKEQERIATQYGPLRIKIRNRRIEKLGYLEGVRLNLRPPRGLAKGQRSRLRVLQDVALGSTRELQFVGIDTADKRAYMEVAYFPRSASLGRSSGFLLDIDDTRRYRFGTAGIGYDVEIDWPDAATWRLVEQVPSDIIELDLPVTYEFGLAPIARPDQHWETNPHDGHRSQYLGLSSDPGAPPTRLYVTASRERGWERAYEVAVLSSPFLAAIVGLASAR